jgi:hypothetical protein
MAAETKLVVRLNPLVLLIFLIPILFLAKAVYTSYQHSSLGVVTSDEAAYYVYTPLGWRRYEKAIIDQENTGSPQAQKLKEMARQTFLDDIEVSREQGRVEQRLFYLLSGAVTILLVVTFLFWFTSEIELSGDVVIVRSPLLRKRDVVKVDNIKNLRIVAAFPSPKKDDLPRFGGWGKVEIDDGEEEPMVISLFAFPGFYKIIKEVLERKPKLKIII